MKRKKEARLITALITDDIINSMMIIGFRRMGIDAGDYHLGIGEIIFKIMGYKEKYDEPVFESYLALLENAAETYVVPDREKLQRPAEKIYEFLCENRVIT